MAEKPAVIITYCPACHWLPRSAWMAQELLYTFSEELLEVSLRPSAVAGMFTIRVGDRLVWDRKRDGGFPDARLLKQRVRDEIAPSRQLGHLDRQRPPSGSSE